MAVVVVSMWLIPANLLAFKRRWHGNDHEATGAVTPAMKETLRKDHDMSARREQLLDEAYSYFGKIIAKGQGRSENSGGLLAVDLDLFANEGPSPVRTRKLSLWGRVNAVTAKRTKMPAVMEAVAEDQNEEEDDEGDEGDEGASEGDSAISSREASPSFEPVTEPVAAELDPPKLTKAPSSGSLLCVSVDAFYYNYVQVYFETWPKGVITDVFRTEIGKVTWSDLEFWCVYSLRQHGAEIHTIDDLHRDVLRQLMFTSKLTKHVEEGEGSMTELTRAASVNKGGARALGRSMTRAAHAQ